LKKSHAIFLCAVTFAAIALPSATGAQESAQQSKTAPPKSEAPPTAAPDTQAGREYSGMYSFLKDGEFVQITVEDEGRVTGFLSRYGESENDKGTFVDQFFHSGKLDGNKLTFTTETVHAAWYEFKGTVERGEGKNPGDEAYYVLKGTLTDNTRDAQKKVTTRSREVVLKLFPEEASQPAARN
jgi:hypothetical protein